jgi:IPT/TIG domain-containing protein/PASTA domain-containing protein
MSKRQRVTYYRRLALPVATLALAACPAAAQAEIVTVGSPLSGTFKLNTSCGSSCTFAQKALPGARLTSPVDGAIVAWHMLSAAPGHGYRLRVLEAGPESKTVAVRGSIPVSPGGFGLETFAATLPIEAGQAVGLDLDTDGTIGFRETVGAIAAIFSPALADGSPATGVEGTSTEYAFNAEVQPVPTVGDVSPAFGPLRGGNKVRVTGTDFEGASGVRFGDAPAASFEVDSETEITVVVPPRADPASVPVSVTTVAGTATSPGVYAYERQPGEEEGGEQGGSGSCTVPKLRGLKLKAAKRSLRKAGCATGRVTRRKGASARRARIVRQKPSPGRVLSTGTKVAVKLGGRR